MDRLLSGNDQPWSYLLPTPFDKMCIHLDHRRKGKKIVVSMDNNWKVRAFIIPPGVAIINSQEYDSEARMILIQCTNYSFSGTGHICLGRMRKTTASGILDLDGGFIEDSFLCIPQVTIIHKGIVKVVLHKLSPPGT